MNEVTKVCRMIQRYNEYKDSGVQWLGEIPSHWEVVPLKYYSDIIMGQSPNGDDLKDNGQLLFMQGNAEFGNRYPHPTSYCDKCSKKSRVGDILMSVRAPVGALNISDRVYGIGRGLCSIRAINVERDFLWYNLIVARNGFKLVSTGSTYDSVSMDTLCGIKLVVPPLPEQQAIAAYLDEATSNIDAAIAQQQKMIDLLNERKQIIINNAVTKGLNPNVKMKDSGVDWIGEIPEGWEVRRMRYLCKIKTGDKDTINRVDDGKYPFYVRSPKVERINSYTFDGEAILMAGDGVGAGKVFHYANGKFGCHQRVYIFHDIQNIKGEYLYFYMKSLFKHTIEQLSAKSTVDSVRLNMIQDFVVAIPSEEEQILILEYLKEQIYRIDEGISYASNQISLLQERKQIIINEVVTGKVKVTK